MALDKLYTQAEAANFLGVSITTLKRWRMSPGSNQPQPTRVGRQIRYLESELRKFVERNTLR